MKTSLKILVILILYLFNSFNLLSQGWENQNLSFSGGIYFKDINTGLISSYKTINGGISWYNINNIGGIYNFPDPNIGYTTSANFIQKTTNFGDTWIDQFNPINESLESIYFTNINTGFACGSFSGLIITTNGGNNWYINSSSLQPTYYFKEVFFTDSVTGFICGYKYAGDTSVVLKTTNCGSNWIPKFFSIISWGRFTSMYFTNTYTGYISSVGSVGYILKTTNAGFSWNSTIIPTANQINSLHFPSSSTGYGACWGGQIVKTTNGGNNWFLQTTGTGSILSNIFFINNNTGYASGQDNTVLKTTDGGGPPIGIEPISNNIPSEYKLHQNYPNPFNPETHINFSIPERSYVKIIIYDIQGRIIDELVNLDITPGTYSVNWNASVFSSGVYYYRMTTIQTKNKKVNYAETKRMVLVK